MEAAGGRALACRVDVRSEEQVGAAMDGAVERFGAIDILVNNASASHLADTKNTPMKRFDLMHEVNVRATFLCSRLCLPVLEASENPHILTLAPPLTLDPRWYAPHLAYTLPRRNAAHCTGNFFIDEEVLREEGVEDFTGYAVDPEAGLQDDLFL